MKRVLLVIAVIVATIVTNSLYAKNINETQNRDRKISLLTCASGDQIYSIFGHTAIRIKSSNSDIVINYGTFDFSTPNFYWKFIQGLLPYQMAIQNYSSFYRQYTLENRAIYEQSLDLDSLEQQKLLEALAENYKPENRTYLYNYLHDNCATRIRDMFENNIALNKNSFHWNTTPSKVTFWNLLDEKLSISPWAKWGIHTILGSNGNNMATMRDEMFLPEYLMNATKNATIGKKKLVSNEQVLLDLPIRTNTTPWYLTPMSIFILIALITIVCTIRRSKTVLNIVATPIFIITGAIGAIIVFLAFTKHPLTCPNWNVLWAFPINLIVWPLFYFKSCKKCVKYYLNAYMGLLIAQTIIILISQPAIPYATLPIVVLMFYISFKLDRQS